MAKCRKKPKQEAPQGAPDWMVTYGDAMTLLLCFFVIIVSMSEIRQDQKFQRVIESLRITFGGYEGASQAVPSRHETTNTLIARLLELEPRTHTGKMGNTKEEGIEGTEFRVTNVRDGIEVVIGGKISFDRFSATLKPEARALVAGTAERLLHYRTKIMVRGHATREPLPADSLYNDAHDLSYERAKSVALELERNGVDRCRIVRVALADTEPLVRQAYTEERRALNRRVEILITEELVEDYEGSTIQEDLEGVSDGR